MSSWNEILLALYHIQRDLMQVDTRSKKNFDGCAIVSGMKKTCNLRCVFLVHAKYSLLLNTTHDLSWKELFPVCENN